MTELFNTSDILTSITSDQAVIGSTGYFGDTVNEILCAIKRNNTRTLLDADKNEAYCFANDCNLRYILFLPADKQKPSFRQLTNLEELFNFLMPNFDMNNFSVNENENQAEFDLEKKAEILLGQKIKLKDKINNRIKVIVIQEVDYSSDNNDSSDTYLNCYSLEDLFSNYDVQINGKFVPFGIEG